MRTIRTPSILGKTVSMDDFEALVNRQLRPSSFEAFSTPRIRLRNQDDDARSMSIYRTYSNAWFVSNFPRGRIPTHSIYAMSTLSKVSCEDSAEASMQQNTVFFHGLLSLLLLAPTYYQQIFGDFVSERNNSWTSRLSYQVTHWQTCSHKYRIPHRALSFRLWLLSQENVQKTIIHDSCSATLVLSH